MKQSIRYRVERKVTKQVKNEGKALSWEKYGQHLTQISKVSPKEFYKSIKAMRLRDESFNQTSMVNHKNSKLLSKEIEINKRWEAHFNEFNNPKETRGTDFISKAKEILEPKI